MEIVCKYNKDLEIFLKQVVQYVIDNYGDNLKLNKLKIIELVKKEEFAYSTDGKTCDDGTKIIVTSRLYELLPTLNLQQLQGDENLEALINTLYHEMIHVTDWNNMPNLYSAVITMNNSKHYLPGLFWLEYIAEKRSCSEEQVSKMYFCDDFVKRKWKSCEFDFQNANEKNFYYLLKAIPYFMARTNDCKIRSKYLQKMRNPLLRKFIDELDLEILNLERVGFFDDPEKLIGLYSIMNKYYKKFKIEFS